MEWALLQGADDPVMSDLIETANAARVSLAPRPRAGVYGDDGRGGYGGYGYGGYGYGGYGGDPGGSTWPM